MAKKSNKFLPPRKDEWYISGAIPEAYRATNDLSDEYDIAKLVLVELVITYKEIQR